MDRKLTLARGDVLLDCPLKAVLLPAAPVVVHSRLVAAKPSLHYLHPVTTTIVTLDTGVGGLGYVDKAWAGVLDELVVEELEPNLVASLDGVRCRRSWLSALVAAQIVRVHELAGV